MAKPLFQVAALHAGYGPLKVLHGIDLTVTRGERVGIFGHNGSGKSTLLKCLVGGVPEAAGQVRFAERPIEPGAVHRNVKLGIGVVPQTRNVFPNLSVDECLEIAGMRRGKADRSAIYGLFPRLGERARQRAGTMSGGEQQMLAVGMALMTKPDVILLDEPTAGLSPAAAQHLLQSLVEVNVQTGTTMLMVEQNVLAALRIVQRAVVVRSGQVVYDGTSAQLPSSHDLWALF